MKFRPLHDRVVVKRIDAEEKTAGGIIIILDKYRYSAFIPGLPTSTNFSDREASMPW